MCCITPSFKTAWRFAAFSMAREADVELIKNKKRRNTFPCWRCFELPAGEYWVEQILSVMVAGRLVKPQTHMLCDATPPKQMLKP